eukprot:gene32837-37079_t
MQYTRLLNLVQRALGAQDDAEMQQRLADLRAIGETTLANGLLALLVEGERADPGPGPGLPPQRETEEDARHRQELTEQILDQLPIPVFLKDREGHFLRFNQRFEEFTQRTREEILGRTI